MMRYRVLDSTTQSGTGINIAGNRGHLVVSSRVLGAWYWGYAYAVFSLLYGYCIAWFLICL